MTIPPNSIIRTYWLTFRLEDGDDYEDRYNALLDCILDASVGEQWNEPTSFLVFRSVLPPTLLARKIALVIDTRADLVLFSLVGSGRGFVVGKLANPSLMKLWPGVSQLAPQGRISGALSQGPAKSGRRPG